MVQGMNGLGQGSWRNPNLEMLSSLPGKKKGLPDVYSLLSQGLNAAAPNAGQTAPVPAASDAGTAITTDTPTDAVDLSSGAAASLRYARVEFEISYQSMQAISSANGMQMKSTSFSISGSFELMELASGNGATSFDDLLKQVEGAEADPFAVLQDYFSPEKTAERILDFATSFFPQSEAYQAEGGDTEASRNSFADTIGAAIQKGFDEALGILGELPEKVQDGVDETHTRVFDGLENFRKNGLNKDKEADGVYERIQAYQWEFSMQMTQTQIEYLTGRDPAANAEAALETGVPSLSSTLEA